MWPYQNISRKKYKCVEYALPEMFAPYSTNQLLKTSKRMVKMCACDAVVGVQRVTRGPAGPFLGRGPSHGPCPCPCPSRALCLCRSENRSCKGREGKWGECKQLSNAIKKILKIYNTNDNGLLFIKYEIASDVGKKQKKLITPPKMFWALCSRRPLGVFCLEPTFCL